MSSANADTVGYRRSGSFSRFSNDLSAYNKAADAIMQKKDIPSIDLYHFTEGLGEDVYCDHVHFTEPARQQQAGFIAGWLFRYFNL